MSFLDNLRALSALACDMILDAVEEVGAEAQISIIVTHPGQGAEDALVVGSHTLAELSSIAAELVKRDEMGRVAGGTVTQSGYTPDPDRAVN